MQGAYHIVPPHLFRFINVERLRHDPYRPVTRILMGVQESFVGL